MAAPSPPAAPKVSGAPKTMPPSSPDPSSSDPSSPPPARGVAGRRGSKTPRLALPRTKSRGAAGAATVTSPMYSPSSLSGEAARSAAADASGIFAGTPAALVAGDLPQFVGPIVPALLGERRRYTRELGEGPTTICFGDTVGDFGGVLGVWSEADASAVWCPDLLPGVLR